jgi:HD-GYP domain-containing protein (c-di-GMP phosphodiesterase class II)
MVDIAGSDRFFDCHRQLMKVVPLSSEGLRIGRPLPFSVRDGLGAVLLAKGSTIQTDKQLQLLRSREIFIDPAEMESVQRAYNGQLDQMLRQDVALGRIASARPEYDALPLPGMGRAAERPLDWPNLQMRLRLLLVDPRGTDWVVRLRALRDDALALVERHPDRALMRLMHDASNEFQDYSANHSLFVCVLTSLACGLLPGWQAAWTDALTLAALTMNVSVTQAQDELARQPGPLSEAQREMLNAHPERSAALLAGIGVDDAVWLHAVRHHHSAPSGPLTGRPVEETVARLIRRADRYAARLSPRKSRPASSATAAAQSALLDEGGHTDEAGQALIRALGLYPPGVWVQLQCGEIAIVLRRTPVAKCPIVASLVGKTGLPLAVPALRNTKLPDFAVTGAVPPAQVKVRPSLDGLEKMA